MEERVPVGVCNSGEGEKRSESCCKGTVGPRPVARKGGKAQEKGGNCDTRVCWSCGENRTHCGKLRQGELEPGV